MKLTFVFYCHHVAVKDTLMTSTVCRTVLISTKTPVVLQTIIAFAPSMQCQHSEKGK